MAEPTVSPSADVQALSGLDWLFAEILAATSVSPLRRGGGLTDPEYLALMLLRSSPRTPTAIGQALFMKPSHVSRVIGTLAGKPGGPFVVIAADPSDRRRSHVSITAAGREALAGYVAWRARGFSRLLSGLGQQDQVTLAYLLERMLRVHRRDP